MTRSRFRLLAAAALALPVTAAPLMAQSLAYIGGGYVSDYANCESQGWSGVSQVTVRYRERWQEGDTDGAISFFFGMDYAAGYRLPDGWALGEWFDATRFGGLGDTPFTWQPDPPVRFRFVLGPAGTVFDGDNALHAVFEAQNWNALPGCTARGELWLRQRVD